MYVLQELCFNTLRSPRALMEVLPRRNENMEEYSSAKDDTRVIWLDSQPSLELNVRILEYINKNPLVFPFQLRYLSTESLTRALESNTCNNTRARDRVCRTEGKTLEYNIPHSSEDIH